MYRNILVPIDGSAAAARGLREAIGLARDLKAQVVVLHVIVALPTMVETAAVQSESDMRAALRRYADDVLTAAQQQASRNEVAAITAVREVKGGGIAPSVLDEARQRGCDLIVMGTHGRRGISHLVLGSDAEAVVRQSDVPVLLVRQPS